MKDKQQPLLTHDQLVDWLIYHCPLFESLDNDRPFMVAYQGQSWRCDFTVTGYDPLEMYDNMAHHITQSSQRIHREITDLYWYWTI
jgi:hypothetical protein